MLPGLRYVTLTEIEHTRALSDNLSNQMSNTPYIVLK